MRHIGGMLDQANAFLQVERVDTSLNALHESVRSSLFASAVGVLGASHVHMRTCPRWVGGLFWAGGGSNKGGKGEVTACSRRSIRMHAPSCHSQPIELGTMVLQRVPPFCPTYVGSVNTA